MKGILCNINSILGIRQNIICHSLLWAISPKNSPSKILYRMVHCHCCIQYIENGKIFKAFVLTMHISCVKVIFNLDELRNSFSKFIFFLSTASHKGGGDF